MITDDSHLIEIKCNRLDKLYDDCIIGLIYWLRREMLGKIKKKE